MKTSLTINATRNGKKVSKSLGYVNPDVANSLVGGFAQMVNALTTDTFVNAEVVKKMDTTEEDSSGGSTPAPAGKQEGIIHLTWDDDYVTVSYNGDGELRYITDLIDISYVENGVDTYDEATVIQNGAQLDRHEMLVFAPATDNFTAAFAVFGDN